MGVAEAACGTAQTLQTLIDSVDDLTGEHVNVTKWVVDAAADMVTIATWAKGIANDYISQEKSISDMMSRGYWFPHASSYGWDTSKTVSENVDRIVRTDDFGTLPVGISGTLLEHMRQSNLYLPKAAGAADKVAEITTRLSETTIVRQNVTYVNGQPWVTRSSGLLVKQNSPGDPLSALNRTILETEATKLETEAAKAFRQPGTSPELVTTPGTTLPRWAKVGTGGLVVLGAGLTTYDIAKSQWEQDSRNHPGWTTGHKAQNAAGVTAVVGTAAVGGGFIGAWAGAKAGATVGAGIGSLFGPGPGTALGGAVGGIVGGLVGGYYGGKLGKFGGAELRKNASGIWRAAFG